MQSFWIWSHADQEVNGRLATLSRMSCMDMDEGADLTLWLRAFLCIVTDEVRGKICFAS